MDVGSCCLAACIQEYTTSGRVLLMPGCHARRNKSKSFSSQTAITKSARGLMSRRVFEFWKSSRACGMHHHNHLRKAITFADLP